MKRIQLDPWTPYDKLSLASAVFRTGDQNWNTVARATRNIFEESTKYLIEEKRPPEWFSNKQCAAQYETLLKNIGPRRKKKSEKSGPELLGDSPNDIIINAVKQECIEELKRSLAATQSLYLKLHKEYEDIQAGKMDHKLEEMLEEYEAKEREKEIKMKLKFKLGEKNPEIMENNLNLKIEENEIKKPTEKEPQVSEPAKTNLTTSPLLTSLLQSPSPLTRPTLPPNTSPTISLLLNSSPSVPTSDSPTLTKLLETSSTVVGSSLVPLINSNATSQVTIKQELNIASTTNNTGSTSTSPVTTQALVAVTSSPVSITTSSSPVMISSTADVISTPSTKLTTTVQSVSTTPVVSTSTTVPSTINTSISVSTTKTAEETTDEVSNAIASKETILPPNNTECEQVSEEVAIKSEVSSEDSKTTEENKEILEIEEVDNPSTPEIVLEDIVHSVVESEVVIDQDTPVSKGRGVCRKLQLEVEEAETDDDVMETVEQMIEKVEEAIIETVGEESAEIDIALNQSSETDNLSDHIETLEMDSDAVQLIVLGHNQGKVITIRHDTEISSDPAKSDQSVDEVPPQLETLEDVDNLVEEEISTSEEKVQEEVLDVIEEIKLREEIVEHEVILEDKESEKDIAGICEENSLSSNVLEDGKVVEEKEEGDGSKEGDSKIEEGKEKIVESVKDTSEEKIIKKEVVFVDSSSIEPSEKITELDLPSVVNKDGTEVNVEKGVHNINDILTKVEEAIVEEAPEEVVIADLVEEVVQAEKRMKTVNTNLEENEEEITDYMNTSIKEEKIETEDKDSLSESNDETQKLNDHEVISIEVPIEIKLEKIDQSLDPLATDERASQEVNSQNQEVVQQDISFEPKEAVRIPRVSKDNHQTSTPELRKKIKIEVEEIKVSESKPIQEIDRRRTVRKRYPLAGSTDSKPNSPAPSSHSMEDDREYKAWKKSIMLVYNRLAAHKYASVFLKPITEAEATGYHKVVFRPMDLTTIKRNIETGVIRSTVEFQRDMILMAQNAMIYNKADSLVFKMAEDMLADMLSQMEVMVLALGDGVPLWGDSEEKLHTRGRASKSQLDDSGSQKRRSLTDDASRRRQLQTEDSTKKRRGQLEDLSSRRKTEDNKKKSFPEDNTKRKILQETISKKKVQLDDTSSKKKGQTEETSGKKKVQSDEGGSGRKKLVSEDTSSMKRKLQTDDVISKRVQVDDTPVSGKRKSQQIEERKKNETPGNKRKSQIDDTPSNRRKTLQTDDTTPVNKRKIQVDDTPINKRKRSTVLAEEPRSGNKRKRADAT